MKRFWILKGLKFLALAPLFILLVGWVVMSLWNWLMPVIFGLTVISFWQALGLLILSKILLGGFHGGGGRHWQDKREHWKQKIGDRWEKMTPEERIKFRQQWQNRCGPRGWNWMEKPEQSEKPSGE